MKTYTALHLFAGLGGGALGFQRARARLGLEEANVRTLVGVDCDAEACTDFERLTGAPAVVADLATMQPGELLEACGGESPDIVFTSPPCKGFSGLLSASSAATAKYQALNRLVFQGLFLTLETFRAKPPRLIVLENVPRITSRGADLLAKLEGLLAEYGYRVHTSTHDCGELGGLGQHRRRFLLVARHVDQVPNYVHRPPRRRVRSIGEVIGELPRPEAPEAGPLHVLPRLQWRTWIRLALIPAGGDWRDLPDGRYAVVADPEAVQRFKGRPGLMKVSDWGKPCGAVTGSASVSGSNGVAAVADPRVPQAFNGAHGVQRYDEPGRTVIGGRCNGAGAVADPSVNLGRGAHSNLYRVVRIDDPAVTVTSATRPAGGALSIADPQLDHAPRRGAYRVVRVDETAPTVTGAAGVGRSCAYAVADTEARLGCEPRAGSYGVMRADEPAGTVTGSADVHQGRTAIADARIPSDTDRPERPPVIIAEDGTWHRPLSTLELAALQSLPVTMPDGSPLVLAGRSSARWRERIGNAVPPAAAEAIAESLLRALLEADAGMAFSLGGTDVWVRPGEEARV